MKIVAEKDGVTTMSCGCQFWIEGETKETKAFMVRACPKGRDCEFVWFTLAESKRMGHGIAIAEKLKEGCLR
jgi:hypothetical protein